MKKFIIVSIILLVIVITVAILVHHKNNTKQPPSTVSVEKGTITEIAQAIGNIQPRHSSTVKSQINGTVAEIYHNEGDFVKKGTSLLKIEPTPSPTEYATTKEALQEASAIEKASFNEIERYQKALRAGYISSRYGDYIAAEKDYSTAKLQKTLAQQKLDLLEKGKAIVGGKAIANVVTSPTDGYILSREVDVGDPVISISAAQSSTALFTIADMHNLMFKGSVDEDDAAQIKIGMPATIVIGALSDQPIMGTLTHISLQSDQQNQDSSSSNTSPFNVGFDVEITQLKIPQNTTLRAGYSATADIKIKTVKDTLVLPERVLRFENGKPYVLLVQTKSPTPVKQPIKVGLSDGLNVQILEGLKLGDKVLDQQPDENTSQ